MRLTTVRLRHLRRALRLSSILLGAVFIAACAAPPETVTQVVVSPPSEAAVPAQPTVPLLPATAPPPATLEPLGLSSLAPGEYLGFSQHDPSFANPPDMFLFSLRDHEVIPFLRSAFHASVSPDRTKIAYLDTNMDLHVLDAMSRAELAFNHSCSSTTWSPDGTSILCGGDNQLVLFPATGGQVLPLAQCGPNPEDMNDCSHSLWSPDGYYIASWRMSASGGQIADLRYDLFILHPRCEPGWRNCTTSLQGPYGAHPHVTDRCDWLFDSLRLLCNNGPDGGLGLLNVPSGDWRRLAGNPCAENSYIAASPNGPQFACDLAGDGPDTIGIGVVSLDAERPVVVLSQPNVAVDFWMEIP